MVQPSLHRSHARRGAIGRGGQGTWNRSTGRAYEQVVDQVRRAIFLGRFLPGDKLPPERELARQLGVSWTTVRESVPALGGEGLVTTRRGAAGGITVEPFKRLEQRTIDNIRRDLEAFEDLLDFRISIEGAAARLAAERRTKQDLVRLGEGVQAMGKSP